MSLSPAFAPLPQGAPRVLLSRVVVVLTGPHDEVITVEAPFRDGVAVLDVDLPVFGASTTYEAVYTAYDMLGVVAFTGRQTIVVKAGRNPAPPAPQLVYDAPDARVTAIRITPGTLTLQAGGSSNLEVSGTLAGGQSLTPRVEWTSSNPAVVAVTPEGVVTAGRSQGTATITATSVTGLTATVAVKVQAPVDKVTITPATVQLIRGRTQAATLDLRDATNVVIDDRTATWTTSDPEVATVSTTGVITGVKVGRATITATAEGKTGTTTVNVISPLERVELTPTTLSFAALKQTATLSPRLVPVTGGSVTGLVVTYRSSNSAVASVDAAGIVTANGNGTATITAEVDGSSATASVAVQQVAAAVTVSPRAASVTAIGESRTFTTTVVDQGSNPIIQPTVVWTSSDPTVASVVGNGATATVTSRRAGTVTITATSDGKVDQATFIISVQGRLLVLLTSKSVIEVGQTMTVSAKIADLNGNPISDAQATLSTSTPDVIAVSGTTVTGRAPGTGRITGTAGDLTASASVTVVPRPGDPVGGGELTVTPGTVEKLPGGTQQFAVSGNTGTVTWTVNGTTGGNSTYGTITTAGFYTAPGAVPNPATFPVCAVEGARSGCASVTIQAIPSGGADVIVINDMNLLQNGFYNSGNSQFFKNVVSFTPVGSRSNATKVVFSVGHASQCYPSQCGPSPNSQLRADMATVGITQIIDDPNNIGPVDPAVKVLFLMNPKTDYTVSEVNNLKAFAGEGGRIVFIGENPGYYGSGIAVENKLLLDLGAQLTNSTGYASCSGQDNQPAANIRPHQTTAGVTNLNVPCATEILLGPNDYALVLGPRGTSTTGTPVPVVAVAKIDIRPLNANLAARNRAQLARKPAVPAATVALPPGVDPTSSTGWPPKQP